MALRTSLQKQYTTLLSHWPADPLRPNLAFPDVLRRRIDHEFNVNPQRPPESAAPSAANTTAKEAEPSHGFDEVYAKRQLNALSSLLENRYRNMYPATDRIMMPRSQPDYYKRLLEELEVAPKRSWLGRQFNTWKGWMRMK